MIKGTVVEVIGGAVVEVIGGTVGSDWRSSWRIEEQLEN